jgi:hypothetical protein
LRRHFIFRLIPLVAVLGTGIPLPAQQPPIQIAFLWHLHQPIYWPYETILETEARDRYDYSVVEIHNQRTGPYTTWPRDAVQAGVDAGFPHFGAQVSFSGSLMENLNNLEAGGNTNFQRWRQPWLSLLQTQTLLGNPRLDLVGFGYHHPLMAFLAPRDLRRQIQDHRAAVAENFAGPPSHGFFPPENAFTPAMIPSLAAEGVEWVLVDNIHLERACAGYPWNSGGNLVEPNPALQTNPDPGDWLQLTGLWAPTPVSARWALQPHRVEYVNPATGAVSRLVVVPAARYPGTEDARGGFGALDYEGVLSQLEPYNTDPDHPLLVVLAHDGDNYGGGSDSYYHHNFQNFVAWLQANPQRFQCTTIQDYLDRFPPAPEDVIQVEPGSWSGADNGDPQFRKWNGIPVDGYSPDRNSWAVIMAARNLVYTAREAVPSDPRVEPALHYLLNAEASDYWYWDGAQDGVWDSHPTRAANLAVDALGDLLAEITDNEPPTLFPAQRDPWNPGGSEWGIPQPPEFTVWSLVYDYSGLESVNLYYRLDLDGVNSAVNRDNETYSGGPDVGAWTVLPMTTAELSPQTDPLPLVQGSYCEATVSGINDALVDYYVEAVDLRGNVARTPIEHVWVGSAASPGGVWWLPEQPGPQDTVLIVVDGAPQGARLHWGVTTGGVPWQTPLAAYQPPGSVLFGGLGPAVETPFTGPDEEGRLTLTLGPFNDPGQPVDAVDFVIHYDDDTWDNNGGADYHLPVGDGSGFVLDGMLDEGTEFLGAEDGLFLYGAQREGHLYLAVPSPLAAGGDLFVFVAAAPSGLWPAPWAKSGLVAGWSAYLAGEYDNGWCGWFDAAGNRGCSCGEVLEGTLDLEAELGSPPAELYLAVGRWESPDGGILTAQLPAGNGDGNIDVQEYLYWETAPPEPPEGVNLEVVESTVILSWERAEGLWYTVEAAEIPWGPFQEVTWEGAFQEDGGRKYWVAPIQASRRFFRVRAQR